MKKVYIFVGEKNDGEKSFISVTYGKGGYEGCKIRYSPDGNSFKKALKEGARLINNLPSSFPNIIYDDKAKYRQLSPSEIKELGLEGLLETNETFFF